MTTTSLVPHVPTSAPVRPGRARLLVAEWVKLRSLRSTWILLAAVVILLIAVPAFSAIGAVVQGASGTPSGEVDLLTVALAGVSPVEFLVAALGALAVTGEYASGLIRVTLAAVPRRIPVLLAKAFIVGAITLVTAVISVLAAFAAVRLLLASAGLPAAAGAPPAVLATALSAGAYLSGLAFIGMAFGWLVRTTVGALAAFFGFLYVPPLLALLPGGQAFAPFLPSNAGAALLHASVAEPLPAATGALVFVAWVTALLVAAALVLGRRDA